MTETKSKSVPAQLADEIESLGWEVSRGKEGDVRTVWACRSGGPVVVVKFERRPMKGAVPYRDVFVSGEHYRGEERFELRSAADALKIVRALPFALDAPDETILAAVAGKRVDWLSRITGKVETGHVPRGGIHLKLVSGATNRGNIAPEDRVLHFADAAGFGFRAVRIGSIVKVS